MTAPGTIEVATVDDPTPGPDDVIVEVAAVGLCGTDLHILAGEHGVLPVVPGHEVTGTVVAAGAEAGEVRVGDRVAVDPSLPCRACRFCRRGRENLCLTLGALGVTTAGGAADYMRAPAGRCVVLPDHVDLHGATLIEPLSCVVRGYDVLRTALGASVLIYGAGTMGLLLLEVAKHTAPRSVHVVDPNNERAERAASLGCTVAAASVDALDVSEKWDVVIDATGNAGAIQDGVGRVARGGTFLQFGVASPEARVSISPYAIYNHEITITGSMAVLHSFERAADLFAADIVDWRAFVTSQRPLVEYADALASFGRGEGVKTQVVPAA
jgi:2-desacetyl-2-hydroxyethyl bacteriochlorophyllide A dehydrogenase